MFINGISGYNRHGEQTARGDFLIVFAKGQELRAAVRHVRMRQFGHFMMGRARLGKYSITLSGSYGADGLPKEATKQEPQKCWTRYYWGEEWFEVADHWEDVPAVNWESLLPLPPELQEEFWHPTHQGWNSCGSEAVNLRKWAKENLTTLRKAGK